MPNSIARLGILLMLAGCNALADEQTRGAALAELHGTLSLGEGVKPPKSGLRVSVIWEDPHIARDLPSACENAKLAGWHDETNLLEQRAMLTTDFPSGFSVSLSEPPPLAAIFDDLDGNGVSGARGSLVVYEDRNGNNHLDPRGFDSTSPDLVFGWSNGTNLLDVYGPKYTVIYLSRDHVPATATYSLGDGKAGYSLDTLQLNSGSLDSHGQRLSEATIDLTLDPTAYVQQAACALRCDVPPETLACDDPNELINANLNLGDQIPLDLGVGSTAWIRQDADKTVYTVATCSVPGPDIGNYNRYTFDYASTSVQGCTQTGTQCVYVNTAESPERANLPCTEYRVGTPGPAVPTEPASPPSP